MKREICKTTKRPQKNQETVRAKRRSLVPASGSNAQTLKTLQAVQTRRKKRGDETERWAKDRRRKRPPAASSHCRERSRQWKRRGQDKDAKAVGNSTSFYSILGNPPRSPNRRRSSQGYHYHDQQRGPCVDATGVRVEREGDKTRSKKRRLEDWKSVHRPSSRPTVQSTARPAMFNIRKPCPKDQENKIKLTRLGRTNRSLWTTAR